MAGAGLSEINWNLKMIKLSIELRGTPELGKKKNATNSSPSLIIFFFVFVFVTQGSATNCKHTILSCSTVVALNFPADAEQHYRSLEVMLVAICKSDAHSPLSYVMVSTNSQGKNMSSDLIKTWKNSSLLFKLKKQEQNIAPEERLAS